MLYTNKINYYLMETVSSIACNISIDDTMTVKLTEKQGDNYRLKIGNTFCLFNKLNLFTNGLFPVKRTMANGSLGWYVERKFVSYKKIKYAILNGSLSPVVKV